MPFQKTLSEDERFWRFVKVTDFCWYWMGALRGGYGAFAADGEQYAHRWSYNRFKGPLVKDKEIHHTCKNRRCVNPDHLVLMIRKDHATQSTNATRSHCDQGHEYTLENTYINPSGHRVCRHCRSLNSASYALGRKK